MSWSAKPYFTENDILYSPGLIYVNNESVVFIEGTNNNFISSLMTIVYNSDNIDVANITTTLTVITRGLGNGTNITCLTYRRVEKSQSFSTEAHWGRAHFQSYFFQTKSLPNCITSKMHHFHISSPKELSRACALRDCPRVAAATGV